MPELFWFAVAQSEQLQQQRLLLPVQKLHWKYFCLILVLNVFGLAGLFYAGFFMYAHWRAFYSAIKGLGAIDYFVTAVAVAAGSFLLYYLGQDIQSQHHETHYQKDLADIKKIYRELCPPGTYTLKP